MYTPSLSVGPILRSQDEREEAKEKKEEKEWWFLA